MKVFCNIKNGFSVAEAMVVLLITSLALAAASPLISRTLKSDGLDMLLQKKNEEKIKELDNKLSNLENKVGVLENNVSEIRNQINTMNNNISSVTNNVNSLKNNITSMTNSINNVSSSLSDLEKKLSDLDTIPSGSIVFFNSSSCPTGWTKVSSTWNGRYPSFSGDYTYCKGAETSTGACDSKGSGGSVTGNSVGKLYGDAIRNITGVGSTHINYGNNYYLNWLDESGALYHAASSTNKIAGAGNLGNAWPSNILKFDASRVVPTSTVNRPRTVALLGCRKN